ncbi:MAG: M20/M25/M40 family metallo-hydrolase [Planctomycetes bacterium]|nr:M20/M25/M40 family metallo-hydrolase [Planctomycetota bacterium]
MRIGVLSVAFVAVFAVLGVASTIPAQDKKDPVITKMLPEVSRERIEADVRTLVGFGTRHTESSTDDPSRGIGAARKWIQAEFEKIAATSGGRMTVTLDSYTESPESRRITKAVEIVNIIATLKGTQLESVDRLYVVSGHYDSICSDPTDSKCDAPGANDDASGVAAVLEAARIMSRHEFDATIVFAAVAAEEQGLYGSKHLADGYRARGVNVAGMFTNDIVGNSLSQFGVRERKHLRVFSEGVAENETPRQTMMRLATGSENDSPARQLARYVADCCEAYFGDFRIELMFRRDRLMRGGDHTSFSRAGYPAVRFTEMNEDYRHQHQNVRKEGEVQYGDLPEFVDFDYLTNVTRVNIAALASLASAPARPKNARIVLDKLSPSTTIAWDRGAEPDVVGYEVVWRPTRSPVWTGADRVGDVDRVTLERSKDNYFFGVRAVEIRPVIAAWFPSRSRARTESFIGGGMCMGGEKTASVLTGIVPCSDNSEECSVDLHSRPECAIMDVTR